MSHTPPVPEGNQSPYPLQEPSHAAPAATLPPVAKTPDVSLAERAQRLPLLAIGAAIGLGAAAIGGLAYAAMRSEGGKRRKGKGGRRRKA